MLKYPFYFLLLLGGIACTEPEVRSDAYGNFEATTVTVSTETGGRLLFLHATEGDHLEADRLVALVDTTALHLQRKQIEATIGTLPAKLRSDLADIEVLRNQERNLTRERDRTRRLVERQAATTRQLDELNGELAVLAQRITAVRSQTRTANRGILAEKGPLLAQIDLINEQIRQSYIYNPVAGRVLTRLAESTEVVGRGSPLYRIGRLDTLTLRVYADAVALQRARIGAPVQVLVDEGATTYRELEGRVTYVAAQAEFTPKTIQTKEDRTTLVYAVKVAVPNPDGRLRIGMPAEVNFEPVPVTVASPVTAAQ